MAQRDSGRFYVLDGVDGCGKSTQARLLVEHLKQVSEGPVQHLREPGSTTLGERLRELLLSRDGEMSAHVESLLFCAARRQMLEELVGPALSRGEPVVCERFHPSTVAYQAFAGGVELEPLMELLEVWSGRPSPDRIILLDLDPEVAARRRGADRDRIEDKGLEFQQRVAEGLRRYAGLNPTAVLVDAAGSEAEVAARVREALADD